MADAKLEILLAAKNTADAAFNKVERQISSLTSAANLLKGAFVGALAGVTVAGAVRGLNSITNAAAAAEETANKVRVVFGEQLADTLDTWARGAADAMGLAKTEALDAVGSIGYMFQQIGASSQEAVGTSQKLVQLAADIASFNNVAGGSAKVLEDMKRAFRGEYDPIQKYIATIHAAAVEQEALARTGKKTKNELTQLDKTMAAVAVITRDAGVAAGDYARTSGSLVNQQRELEARFMNTREEMGKNLIPAKLKMVTTINEWIEANEKLLQQDVPRWIETMVTGLGKLITAGSETIRILKEIGEHYSAISHDREDLLARAAKYVHAGLVDLNEVLSATDKQLSDILDKLDKTTRISEDGVRYTIGPQTEGYEARKNAPPPSGGTGTASGRGVFDTSSQAFNSALDSAIAEYQQMAAAQFRLSDKDTGFNITDLISFNIPGDAADEAHRELQEMLDRRKEQFEESNQQLVDLTQHTAELMQENFSNLFYDAITGEMKSFADYMEGIFDSLAKAWSDMMGKMAAEWLFGEGGQGIGDVLMNLGKSALSALGGSGGGSYVPGAWGAKGLVYDQGGVKWHASGDILSAPTIMPLRNGSWVGGGEAGTEAIMPLRRGPNGRLGVEAAGGGMTVNVSLNLSAMDSKTGAQWLKDNAPGVANAMADHIKHNPAFSHWLGSN